MKKLTYTKKELMKEARTFSIYYGRVELMSEGTRKRYEAFCEKCRIYEEEKHEKTENVRIKGACVSIMGAVKAASGASSSIAMKSVSRD